MNVKILLVLISSLLITGCSFFKTVDPVVIKTEEVERVKLNLPDPKPVNLKDIDWYVITPENQEELFLGLKESFDPVLYGLTDEDYEDISKNMVILRNYIMELRMILDKYRDYYEKEAE